MFTHTKETTDEGYRSLAAAVLKQTFDDILQRGPVAYDVAGAPPKDITERGTFYRIARTQQRTEALAFLFAPRCHRGRAHWLAWLHMTEGDLWRLLGRPTFQGCRNRLLPHVRANLRILGVACG